MKILGISSSPRPKGNTVALLERALSSAESEGAEVELYTVADKIISPCDGCFTCKAAGVCHLQDDMQDLYEMMLSSHGIIFGTPTQFYSMAAQAKAIIDRSIALGVPERSLANKVGAAIVVGGSLGLVDGLKDLVFYMVTRRMLPAGFVAAYARSEGDVLNRGDALEAASDLGRLMVRVIAKGFEYPTEFQPTFRGFGTLSH